MNEIEGGMYFLGVPPQRGEKNKVGSDESGELSIRGRYERSWIQMHAITITLNKQTQTQLSHLTEFCLDGPLLF